MSLSFLGVYKRGLRGGSRFVWTPESLGIIIRGLFQFHRSGRKLPLHLIAPHLRSLIRECVKTDVCVRDGQYHHWAADQFDLVCDRWVRLPSLSAVLLKLEECSRFVYLVSSTEASYQSLRDEGIMSEMFFTAMTREMSRITYSHDLHCSSSGLPAIPRPSAGVPVFGYCFTCGAGLSDKTDFNFIPRCSCRGEVGDGDDVCLCSSCVGGVRPPTTGCKSWV